MTPRRSGRAFFAHRPAPSCFDASAIQQGLPRRQVPSGGPERQRGRRWPGRIFAARRQRPASWRRVDWDLWRLPAISLQPALPMFDLVIYHGSCRDGFTAAWVARLRYPGAQFHPGYFRKRPPQVSGREVLILDFSYPRSILRGMAAQAASLLLLDHHKSAEIDL